MFAQPVSDLVSQPDEPVVAVAREEPEEDESADRGSRARARCGPGSRSPAPRQERRPAFSSTGSPCETRTRSTPRSVQRQERRGELRVTGLLRQPRLGAHPDARPCRPPAGRRPGRARRAPGSSTTTSVARAVRRASIPPGSRSAGRNGSRDRARAAGDRRFPALAGAQTLGVVALDHRGRVPRVPEDRHEDVHGRPDLPDVSVERRPEALRVLWRDERDRRGRRRPPSRSRPSRRLPSTPRGARSSARGRARSA